ncbi:His-Xaa-Ser system radical SAM maturase HxsB [Methylophaga thalassica]|uniref:His-Xaa-Ser system radical SAM maturase HxsB n=1 Tax=Methylophaga aminisulfidivorans TaxID=230105 RepID=UPI0024E24DDC|nr:His-Xaa-Ser system radical SAM maturase HxsB [Methylophaga aminisulfidivorans]
MTDHFDYQLGLLPVEFHRVNSKLVVLMSITGDYLYSDNKLLEKLTTNNFSKISLEDIALLKSKHILGSFQDDSQIRLLLSRIKTKKETVLDDPSLHIIVPTIECEHTCQYCQVSRQLKDDRYVMSHDNLMLVCETIFQSKSQTLTIEFQGGDPLLRIDLIFSAMNRVLQINSEEGRNIRFIISSSLHQLTPDLCKQLSNYNVYFSTSIDGPKHLHNANRPLNTKDAYQRTLKGIELVREYFGEDHISALMTTTQRSLSYPKEIVDEYVKLGFKDIFMRPLSPYGFAKRNSKHIKHSSQQFIEFYRTALNRIREWREKGVEICEFTESLIQDKVESPFDSGYVDNQTPSGAGSAVFVYNYDGYVYPSDESRMLAETGDISHRLGPIGLPLVQLRSTSVVREIRESSNPFRSKFCRKCEFKFYCGPEPISTYNETGNFKGKTEHTTHCVISKTMLSDYFSRKLENGLASYEKLNEVKA